MKAAGVYLWADCPSCAMGVVARTGADVEVYERDRLTGEPIVVKTLNGSVASFEPSTAVAWFGQRTQTDGSRAFAGCFHQALFASHENLRKWVEANPLETGAEITISRALDEALALTPGQMRSACNVEQVAPR